MRDPCAVMTPRNRKQSRDSSGLTGPLEFRGMVGSWGVVGGFAGNEGKDLKKERLNFMLIEILPQVEE